MLNCSTIVLVNFSSSSYISEINETLGIVRIEAYGEFRNPFLVNVSISAQQLSERSTFAKKYFEYVCALYIIAIISLLYVFLLSLYS